MTFYPASCVLADHRPSAAVCGALTAFGGERAQRLFAGYRRRGAKPSAAAARPSAWKAAEALRINAASP